MDLPGWFVEPKHADNLHNEIEECNRLLDAYRDADRDERAGIHAVVSSHYRLWWHLEYVLTHQDGIEGVQRRGGAALHSPEHVASEMIEHLMRLMKARDEGGLRRIAKALRRQLTRMEAFEKAHEMDRQDERDEAARRVRGNNPVVEARDLPAQE